MDQIKAGAFLKDLRREKGITQEQFASVCLWNQRSFNICYGVDVPAVYNRIAE